MTSIRKLAYAVVLTLSALNFAPSVASAQDEGGSFTLAHEVHWQNVVVPAGDYRFTLQPKGPLEMIILTKLSGRPASFMLFANVTEAVAGSEAGRLVIQSKFGERYVSAMDLPQFAVTLYFAAPPNAGKVMAELHTVPAVR